MSSEQVFAVAEPFPVVASEASAFAAAVEDIAADMQVVEGIAADMVVAGTAVAVAEDTVAVEVAEATVLVVAEADMVVACASMVELVVHLSLVSSPLLRIPLWRIHRILNIWLSLNRCLPGSLICWLRLPRIHLRLL